jgi:hypothetical protein
MWLGATRCGVYDKLHRPLRELDKELGPCASALPRPAGSSKDQPDPGATVGCRALDTVS